MSRPTNRRANRRTTRRTTASRPRQLVLEGIDPSVDDSFPFRLDDETCRIGLENVARMRRILDGFRSVDAA